MPGEQPVWVSPPGITVSYLFYQGRNSTQVQAARYTGGQPIITTTGEVAQCTSSGVLTIPREHLWLHKEIPEINLEFSRKSWLIAPLRHFFSGIYVRSMRSGESLGYKPLYETDHPGSVRYYSVNHNLASLCQETDKCAHKEKYDALMARAPGHAVVLYGVSRGAGATFSATDKADLCILEGPPSSLRRIFKFYFTKILGKLLYNKITAYLFLGGKHSTDKAQQPIGHVDTFPNNVPLVIVSSKRDWIVPHESSIRLALRVAAKRIAAREEAIARGVPRETADRYIAPVYFIQLDRPGHNGYTKRGTRDAERYQNAIHAIYRAHGLSHVPAYADLGAEEMHLANLTDPNDVTKVKQMQYQREFWEHRPLESEQSRALRRRDLRATAAAELANEPRSRIRDIFLASPLHSKPLPWLFSWFSFARRRTQAETGDGISHVAPKSDSIVVAIPIAQGKPAMHEQITSSLQSPAADSVEVFCP